jgi:copper(I)-binding protein
MNLLRTLLFYTSIFISTTTFADINGLTIDDAWIAEAPPGSKVMVGYMMFKNTSSADVTIVSAESPVYSSIEFHETIHKDGMARMIRHRVISVAENSSTLLTRGGKHLMLFNPTSRLKAGDKVTIKFTSDTNQTVDAVIPVKKSQY